MEKKHSRDWGNEGRLLRIRALLYGIAVLFVVLGIFNGGMRDVFVKAIQICTECIGLG